MKRVTRQVINLEENRFYEAESIILEMSNDNVLNEFMNAVRQLRGQNVNTNAGGRFGNQVGFGSSRRRPSRYVREFRERQGRYARGRVGRWNFSRENRNLNQRRSRSRDNRRRSRSRELRRRTRSRERGQIRSRTQSPGPNQIQQGQDHPPRPPPPPPALQPTRRRLTPRLEEFLSQQRTPTRLGARANESTPGGRTSKSATPTRQLLHLNDQPGPSWEGNVVEEITDGQDSDENETIDDSHKIPN